MKMWLSELGIGVGSILSGSCSGGSGVDSARCTGIYMVIGVSTAFYLGGNEPVQCNVMTALPVAETVVVELHLTVLSRILDRWHCPDQYHDSIFRT